MRFIRKILCIVFSFIIFLPQPMLSTPIDATTFTDYVFDENAAIYKLVEKPSGYIIEFYEEPVVEYGVELEDAINYRYENLEKSNPLYRYTLGIIDSIFINYDNSTIKDKIRDQRSLIERRQEELKNYAKKTKSQYPSVTGNFMILGASEKEVLGEYTDVFSGIALNISAEDAKNFLNLNYVMCLYPNNEVKATLMDSTKLIRAVDLWESGYTGRGVKVAVIDTGIDYTHPDLGGCYGQGCKVEGGYDFFNYDNDPMDDQGHGTQVAGVIAGSKTAIPMSEAASGVSSPLLPTPPCGVTAVSRAPAASSSRSTAPTP